MLLELPVNVSVEFFVNLREHITHLLSSFDCLFQTFVKEVLAGAEGMLVVVTDEFKLCSLALVGLNGFLVVSHHVFVDFLCFLHL